MRGQGQTGSAVVIGVAGGFLALAAAFPIGRVRVGSATREVYLGFAGLRYLVTFFVVIFVTIALVELLILERKAYIAAVGFGLVGTTTMLWIVSVEGVALLLPRGLLPRTIRRFTLGMGAGLGAWIALVLCAVLVLACVDLLGRVARRLGRDEVESNASFVRRVSLTAIAGAGIVILGIGRSTPLATVEIAGRGIDVDPWAIPYLGPGSLIGMVAMTAAAVSVAARWKITPAAVTGSALAWIGATISGLAFATSSLIFESGLINWAANRVGREDFAEATAIDSRPGAMLMFMGSVIAGMALVGQLATTRDHPGDDGMARHV